MTAQAATRRPCAAVATRDGAPQGCPNHVEPGAPYCAQHLGPLQPLKAESASEFMHEWRVAAETALAKRIADPKSLEHDPELVRALLPFGMLLYSKYWRVDTYGVENIPTSGPALIAANHSGTLPIDGAMLKMAVLKEHGRNPWLLAADLVFTVPGFRELVRVAGNARADRDETLSLLREGEMIGVFPEGFKGIGKGWRKRYQLQRFGRGGFIEVAMESGAPIIPCAIIGAEEAYPMIANLGSIARKFGLPYFPVTPTWPLLGPLGALPLPSKWIIAFGEPIPMIDYGAKAIQDTQLVLELSEEVRQRVQGLINEFLVRRRRPFL